MIAMKTRDPTIVPVTISSANNQAGFDVFRCFGPSPEARCFCVGGTELPFGAAVEATPASKHFNCYYHLNIIFNQLVIHVYKIH